MKIKKNQGFTLIEVILALLIICIVFSGFSRMICSNMKIKRYTENKRIIMNWAQTVIEYIKTLNLEEYNGKYTGQDFPGLNEYKNEIQNIDRLIKSVKINICNYIDENIEASLFQVNICVEWERNNQPKSYKLSTLVYQDNS